MDLSDLGLAVLVAVFAAFPLGMSVWALLDAARRPQWAWALAGRSQVAWMAGILFGMFSVIGGLILSAWYLRKIRPVIAAAEEGEFR
ncbi:MAG: hypothetical protein ABIY48_03030 [Acidimicrobiales bacterium]